MWGNSKAPTSVGSRRRWSWKGRLKARSEGLGQPAEVCILSHGEHRREGKGVIRAVRSAASVEEGMGEAQSQRGVRGLGSGPGKRACGFT